MSYVQVPPDGAGKKLYTQQHVIGADTVQGQVMHLADHLAPENFQRVDERGQAFVRFSEGTPTIDAFNNLRVGEGTSLGGYEFSTSDMYDLFQDVTTGTASVTWIPNQSSTLLSVGSAATDSSKRTTNRYHYYQPGVSNLVYLTVACGDTGKSGNTRRWGYYDDNDGIFFELKDTTVYIVLRTSVGGVVSETRVPQSAWNGDVLDGSGLSGINLNISKANFYGFDYAWLGVGVIRMGVWAPDGTRWVVHTFQNPGLNTGPYMRTGSLPLRYENFNTALTAGTSELKQICAAVYSQARTDYSYWRFSDIERLTPVTVTTNTPIFSMRVKAGSRVGIYPEALNLIVTGGAVKFTIVDDTELTGATWTINGEGFAQGDVAATACTGGSDFYSFFVGEGVYHKELAEYYETNDEGYHRLADDSDSYVFTLKATKLTGTTVTVAAGLNYKELR